MAQWRTAQCSTVVERSRADAEYHAHSAWSLEKKFINARLPVVRLRQICRSLTSGHTPLRHDLTVGDVDFLTVECVSALSIHFSLAKRVMRTHYEGELSRVAVEPDSVLTTIKRRICQSTPCYTVSRPAVVNQDVAILRLKDGWYPGFVAAYLCSRMGQELADRERTEQMNPYIPIGLLGNLLVPKLSDTAQKEVDDIVRQKLSLDLQASELYAEAEVILDTELSTEGIATGGKTAYEARFSEIRDARRFDGEYFKPAFVRIADHVREYRNGSEPLLRNIQEVRPSIDPSKQPDETFRYSELADINPSVGIITSAAEVLGCEAPSRARRLIAKNDVLVSTVAGSIDKAALVGEKFEGTLASTGFFQFRSERYDPRFLLILLRCKATRMQLEREANGGILSAVSRSRLRNVVVPTVPQDLQDEIARKVDKSHAAYRGAEALLDTAKKRVEDLILKEASA